MEFEADGVCLPTLDAMLSGFVFGVLSAQRSVSSLDAGDLSGSAFLTIIPPLILPFFLRVFDRHSNGGVLITPPLYASKLHFRAETILIFPSQYIADSIKNPPANFRVGRP